MDILQYGFMQRALIAGFFVSITCAVLGVFLILKRDAMIGHGLSHVTFGGVALGLLLHIDPFFSALAVSIVAGLGILKLKEKAGLHGDTGIGIFSSIGIAFGVVAATVANGLNVEIFGYLFGSILAITTGEVWASVALTFVVLATVILFYQRLLFVTFDHETARASGIKAERMDQIIVVLTAIVVVVGMKVVGLLLVAALIVIPAAAALQVARSFWQALVLAAAVALVAVLFGLYVGVVWDWPISGSIVLFSSLIFLLCFGLRQKRR